MQLCPSRNRTHKRVDNLRLSPRLSHRWQRRSDGSRDRLSSCRELSDLGEPTSRLWEPLGAKKPPGRDLNGTISSRTLACRLSLRLSLRERTTRRRARPLPAESLLGCGHLRPVRHDHRTELADYKEAHEGSISSGKPRYSFM